MAQCGPGADLYTFWAYFTTLALHTANPRDLRGTGNVRTLTYRSITCTYSPFLDQTYYRYAKKILLLFPPSSCCNKVLHFGVVISH